MARELCRICGDRRPMRVYEVYVREKHVVTGYDMRSCWSCQQVLMENLAMATPIGSATAQLRIDDTWTVPMA